MKIPISMSARVSLYQGWEPDVAPEPDWTGTLEEFWEANPDYTFGEMTDMRRALAERGADRLGGGAQACFTLKLVPETERAPPAAVERDKRLCKAAGKLYDALVLAKEYIEAAIEDNETGRLEGVYDDVEPYKRACGHLEQIEAALAEVDGS